MQKKYTAGLIAASLFGSAYAADASLDVSSLKKLNIGHEISGFSQNAISKVLRAQKEHYYIVRLEAQPLASMGFATVSTQRGNSLNIQSAAAQAHINVLAQQRSVFTSQLKTRLPSAKIGRHYDAVMNAVVVRSKTNIYKDLANINGVTHVYKDQMRHISMDTSPDLIGATAIWEQLGGKENAGKGVKVAVIDTGIRPEHPMFDDAGMDAPQSLPGDDYCATAADFCNNKLIVARTATPNFEVNAAEHLTPLGFRTHGTHVAGTAVGVGVTTNYEGNDVTLSGVAPGAWLMAYKGLYSTPEGGGSGSDVMLLDMLNWAVKDGADVINNSWGGGAGGDPANSVYGEVFAAAENAGVVIVTAAGNDGPGAQTIGCPSCVEAGISVASSLHGRFFGNTVAFGDLSDALAIPGTVVALEEDISGMLVSALSVDDANFEGCVAFPADSFSGKIALISRGACSFADKINNAAAAGATAVVIYNNRAGAPAGMGGLESTSIPSVMISQLDGEAILAGLSAGSNQVTISADIESINVPVSVDTMSDFSSRGPNGDAGSLKPDITAPGSNILSGVSPEDSDGAQYGLSSGTSMASPHVAGAAAIMRQAYPDWSATDIKTALTSTSKHGLHKEDYETPVDAFDVGAGRLDLTTSTIAGITFDKPSMAMNPCLVTCNFTRTIINKASDEMVWNASVTFDDAQFSGMVTPSSVTLAALGEEGANEEFVVHINASNSEAQGWAFGQVTWTDPTGTHPDAHMPIAVSIDGSTLSSNASAAVDGKIQMSSTLLNTDDMFDEQVRIDIQAPQGTSIVSGSPASTLNGATEILIDHDEIGNRLVWTGNLDSSSFVTQTVSGGFGLPSLADIGVPVTECSGECDEVAIDIDLSGNGWSFAYNGQRYSQLTISDNGFIIAGGGSTAGGWANQDLPSGTAPNNVIAPFWTDMDLNGTDSATGGGDIHVGFFEFTGGVVYAGIEWKNAQVFNDVEGKQYTFQVWISTGETQDIFFNYVDMDSTLPADLTVGAEGALGLTGSNYHFNGTGNPVMSALGVNVTSSAAGGVTLDYDLEVTGPLQLGVADSVDAVEDGGAISIAPLSNDNVTGEQVVDITLTHAGQSFHTPKTVSFPADGELDVATVAIVTEPMHGTVVVNDDGTLDYTPNANFYGADSFTYDVADAGGNRMAATSITVNTAAVNDLPTVTAGDNIGVNEGTNVSLSATAEDIDGDTLTYSWTQVSGTDVDLTAADTADLSFTAPQLDSGIEALEFMVSVNDGTDTVTDNVTVTVNDIPLALSSSGSTGPKGGGGSTGLLALLLLPLAFIRRRFSK